MWCLQCLEEANPGTNPENTDSYNHRYFSKMAFIRGPNSAIDYIFFLVQFKCSEIRLKCYLNGIAIDECCRPKGTNFRYYVSR